MAQVVSHGNVTFNQEVQLTQPQLIIPSVDADDASQFSYHKFVYLSPRDQVCIIIRPKDEGIVKKYKTYVNFNRAPTLISYKFFVDVSADSDWQVCILPQQMQGHSGVTYLGIQIPAEGRILSFKLDLKIKLVKYCITHTQMIQNVLHEMNYETIEMVLCPATKGFHAFSNTFGPRHEKTCLRGLRPGKTQTGLLSYRS